jgi:hypothetical protein
MSQLSALRKKKEARKKKKAAAAAQAAAAAAPPAGGGGLSGDEGDDGAGDEIVAQPSHKANGGDARATAAEGKQKPGMARTMLAVHNAECANCLMV